MFDKLAVVDQMTGKVGAQSKGGKTKICVSCYLSIRKTNTFK